MKGSNLGEFEALVVVIEAALNGRYTVGCWEKIVL